MRTRTISDSLMDLIKGAPGNRYHAEALMYLNRATFELVRDTFVGKPKDPYDFLRVDPIGSMFGIPIVCYYRVPIDRWELVQRGTGELIKTGDVWQWEKATGTIDGEPLRAPQLTDLGICQSLGHSSVPHLRDNSCAMWVRTE